jgi:NPCBM/NEW2 domain
MPLDANCPQCQHTFPVTEARHPFTVSCPQCDGDLTVEFRKPSVQPEPGDPHYELLVKPGALPGTGGPPPAPKRKSDDDEDVRGGGSVMVVLLSGGLGLLFVLLGLGVTGWYLFTQVDTGPDYTNRNNLNNKTNRPGNTVSPTPNGGGTRPTPLPERPSPEPPRPVAQAPAGPRRPFDTDPVAKSAGRRLYVVALTPFDYQPGPWRYATGATGSDAEHPIKVQNRAFPYGISACPPDSLKESCRVSFVPSGEFRRLRGGCALNDYASPPWGKISFSVWGDGKKRWESAPLGSEARSAVFDVDVSGVKVLTLETRVVEGSHLHGHAVWLDPWLER